MGEFARLRRARVARHIEICRLIREMQKTKNSGKRTVIVLAERARLNLLYAALTKPNILLPLKTLSHRERAG